MWPNILLTQPQAPRKSLSGSRAQGARRRALEYSTRASRQPYPKSSSGEEEEIRCWRIERLERMRRHTSNLLKRVRKHPPSNRVCVVNAKARDIYRLAIAKAQRVSYVTVCHEVKKNLMLHDWTGFPQRLSCYQPDFLYSEDSRETGKQIYQETAVPWTSIPIVRARLQNGILKGDGTTPSQLSLLYGDSWNQKDMSLELSWTQNGCSTTQQGRSQSGLKMSTRLLPRKLGGQITCWDFGYLKSTRATI